MIVEKNGICLFDATLLDSLSQAALTNSRKRQNHNLHATPNDSVQRFFNAIEPGSYVVPHRHLAAGKEETLVMLRGHLGLVIFDAAGKPTQTHQLGPVGPNSGFHLGLGIWHSVVALSAGTIFFEVKTGPYQPLSETERATWAPAEGSMEAAAYLKHLCTLFDAA